jgi:hypothetical protein
LPGVLPGVLPQELFLLREASALDKVGQVVVIWQLKVDQGSGEDRHAHAMGTKKKKRETAPLVRNSGGHLLSRVYQPVAWQAKMENTLH